MVFSGLAERLQETFKKLRDKGRLTEEDVDLALKEVRRALISADVNFMVVKDFISRIRERAVGVDVLQSLTPAQQVIKIVRDELAALMGGTQSKINLAPTPPTVIMMVGLHGAGKTTTSAKLASLMRRQGRRPELVAADVYRPAAIKQLQVLGGQINVPVFSMGEQVPPPDIAKAALEQARREGHDLVIIDTAGRLHIDEDLMGELRNIASSVKPHEILLVVDSMTGQDAVNVAKTFNENLTLTGVVLTKLDGDTRGGAALSVKAVTGCPIKFAGMGEKLDALEVFHPDRMADRILGMGDMLTLIEKAQANFDADQVDKLNKRIKSMEFTLDDFLEHMNQVKKMGPLDQVLGMIPGMGNMKKMKDLQIDEKELVYLEAIISSMTPWERQNPQEISGNRRRRVAKGSGTSVQEVNRLLKQFEQTRKMMRQLMGMEKNIKKGKMKNPFGLGKNSPF
ncbi:MAG TPA: signal recognition particle protein [Desulfotomaculum sp.]|nr:MAG: signal recognition particle [Desulfotomaculum sp. BICA1-6]HBX22375.1 signal recognition particle protein [Desulfotomaculum sp.]